MSIVERCLQAPDLYPDDLLLNKPYEKEPTGRALWIRDQFSQSEGVAVLPFHFIPFPLPLGSVFRIGRLIWRQKVLGAFSLPWHCSALREAQTREHSSILLKSIYLLCPRPIWCLVSTPSVMSTSLAPLTCFVMLGT